MFRQIIHPTSNREVLPRERKSGFFQLAKIFVSIVGFTVLQPLVLCRTIYYSGEREEN